MKVARRPLWERAWSHRERQRFMRARTKLCAGRLFQKVFTDDLAGDVNRFRLLRALRGDTKTTPQQRDALLERFT